MRLREDGDKWLQTVKCGGSRVGGLSKVHEFETPVDTAAIDLDAIPDKHLRKRIRKAAAQAALQSVYETDILRMEGEVATPEGTHAMLAADTGFIRAGTLAKQLWEVEIELKCGPEDGIFKIASAVLPNGRSAFSRYAKADRAYFLLTKGAIDPVPDPRRASFPEFPPLQATDQVARLVLRECAEQIVSNVATVAGSDVLEGPHQLRIGLRRFRSALTLFGDCVSCPEASRLSIEAKWLGRTVGRLRDLDVLASAVIKARSGPEMDSGFLALKNIMLDARQEVLFDVRDKLAGDRVSKFMFDIVAFAETQAWISEKGRTRSGKTSVRKAAGKALSRTWKKAAKVGNRIDILSADERHQLRKLLKRLRYEMEFVAQIYPVRDVKPFRKKLERLQDVFGAVNDAEMVRETLSKLPRGEVMEPSLQQAIGWIIGRHDMAAETAWVSARKLWSKLGESEPFWSR